jgi:hypothetical protein
MRNALFTALPPGLSIGSDISPPKSANVPYCTLGMPLAESQTSICRTASSHKAGFAWLS